MRKLLSVLALAAGLLSANCVTAAEWPSGTVQVVIPSKPGGAMDIMGRIFANFLQEKVGSPVVVLNLEGGGGTLAYEQVRTSNPDGRALLFTSNQLLMQYYTGQYDHPVSDFSTIAIMQSYPPQVFATQPDSPWNSLKDFVEDARKNPGKYKVGVTLGGVTHFIAGTVMVNESIKLRLVQAASETDKIAALQGGFIEVGNLNARSAEQYEKAGKLKVLGMIDAEPDPKFPTYKTAISQGLNVSWASPMILWGPAKMPADIVEKINSTTRGFAEDPTIKDQLEKMSSRFRYKTVQEAGDFISEEDKKIGELAKALGLAAH